jgi:leader peptidase (prepilin peptidase) / N-methyltransferase
MALRGMRVSEPAQTISRFRLRPLAVDLSSRIRSGAAVAGSLASVLVIAHFGFAGEALVGVVLVSVLTVLATIDLERGVLPNRIVLPALFVVLALQLALFPDRAFEWIAASLAVGILLLVAALAKPGGLGYGDVKLGLLLGAGLGQNVLVCLLVGTFAMWPLAVYLYIRHGHEAKKMVLPFGPFLALGAVVALLTA